MTAELNARGRACSENTVARLMTAHDIRARTPRRFVRTTDPGHAHPTPDDRLGRDFTPACPNAAWSADITYLPTREGRVYLAVVEDLFSRMIVGWSMAESMVSRLVVDALEWALSRRRPTTRYRKHPRGPKKPPVPRRRDRGKPHVATAGYSPSGKPASNDTFTGLGSGRMPTRRPPVTPGPTWGWSGGWWGPSSRRTRTADVLGRSD